jgi:hypothetical protein
LNRIIKKSDNYICFDTDENEIKKLNRKIYNKLNDKKTSKELSNKYKNVVIFSDEIKMHDYVNSNIINHNNVIFIISEVIEHIELSQVKSILFKLYTFFLTNQSIKLIITTPNRDFNCNYFDCEGFRHHDHKFEFTDNEFKTFINETIEIFNKFQTKYTIKSTYHDIGDSVNNVFTTQGAIITI